MRWSDLPKLQTEVMALGPRASDCKVQARLSGALLICVVD